MKKIFLFAVLALSLLVTGCSASATEAPAAAASIAPVTADSTITAEGRLEPVYYTDLAFNASGPISDVLVKEGQPVKKGDALIRLGDESDANYAAAQLEMITAKQALNDLSNAAGTDLAQAVIDLKDAQEAYDKADHYLKYLLDTKKVPQTETRSFLVPTRRGYQYQYKTKSFKGPAPEDWITEAENDLALKKAKLDEAQRAYDRLKGGTDSDQLAILEARLDAAQAGVAALTVAAPFDGVVADLNAKAGSSANLGSKAATIADFSSWLVKTTDLTELDVVNLNEGDPVVVTLDAIPDVELKGTIQSIGQTYSENQGDVVYDVTVVLNDIHPAMRWGMTANVLFQDQD